MFRFSPIVDVMSWSTTACEQKLINYKLQARYSMQEQTMNLPEILLNEMCSCKDSWLISVSIHTRGRATHSRGYSSIEMAFSKMHMLLFLMSALLALSADHSQVAGQKSMGQLPSVNYQQLKSINSYRLSQLISPNRIF